MIMIIIKTIVFFLVLLFTFVFIEDVIEKIILMNKKDYESLHLEYTHGLSGLFDSRVLVLMTITWTGFYLLNIL